MKKTFDIATLTCNYREVLFETLESFFNNTTINNLKDTLCWFIFIQGYTDVYLRKVEEKIEQYKTLYKINFILIKNRKNLGLSKGANKLAEAVKDYEFVLYCEDDWYCLPQTLTGISKYWLKSCLSFLRDNGNVSTLFLRKYVNDAEKIRYRWKHENGRWFAPWYRHKFTDNFNYANKMKESNIIYYDNIKFQEIPTFLFTFNPHIRRNNDYYKTKVFPLDEYDDINCRREKWSQTREADVLWWGYSECLAMEKTRDLITYNVGTGIFGHYEDWSVAGKI